MIAALQGDDLSMAAGELFGDAAMAVALARVLPGLTRLLNRNYVLCLSQS